MSEVRPVSILLVEDDDVAGEAIERSFRKQRIANPFVIAKDAKSALHILDSTSDGNARFIILLDLNLPGDTGFDFLKKLRSDERFAHSIVFVLTNSELEKDRAQAYSFNVAGYIVKEKAKSDFAELTTLLELYWRIVIFPDAPPIQNSREANL